MMYGSKIDIGCDRILLDMFNEVESHIENSIINKTCLVSDIKMEVQYDEIDFRLKEKIMQDEMKVKVSDIVISRMK